MLLEDGVVGFFFLVFIFDCVVFKVFLILFKCFCVVWYVELVDVSVILFVIFFYVVLLGIFVGIFVYFL